MLILLILFIPTTLLFLRASWKKNKEILKAVAVFTLSVSTQLIFAILTYKCGPQKTAIIAFLSIWLLWVLWPNLGGDRWTKWLALSSYTMVAIVFLLMNSAVIYDSHYRYSDAKNCACFILENLPENSIVFETSSTMTSSIVAYLDSEGFYSLESGELESFTTWCKREPVITNYATFCKAVKQIDSNTDSAYILYQIEEIEPFTDIFAHSDEEHVVYASFKEMDLLPQEHFSLIQIPVMEN